eukprot:PhF_6_TR37554/c0_g1_i1/m.55630
MQMIDEDRAALCIQNYWRAFHLRNTFRRIQREKVSRMVYEGEMDAARTIQCLWRRAHPIKAGGYHKQKKFDQLASSERNHAAIAIQQAWKDRPTKHKNVVHHQPLENPILFMLEEDSDAEDTPYYFRFVEMISGTKSIKEELAAKVVQRAFRCSMSRQQRLNRVEQNQVTTEHHLLTKSAQKIQTFARSQTCKSRNAKRMDARLRIQRWWRNVSNNPTLVPIRTLVELGRPNVTSLECVLVHDWSQRRIAKGWRHYQDVKLRNKSMRTLRDVMKGYILRNKIYLKICDIVRVQGWLLSVLSKNVVQTKLLVDRVKTTQRYLRAVQSKHESRNRTFVLHDLALVKHHMLIVQSHKEVIERQRFWKSVNRALTWKRNRVPPSSRVKPLGINLLLEVGGLHAPRVLILWATEDATTVIQSRYRGHLNRKRTQLREICRGLSHLNLTSSLNPRRIGWVRLMLRATEDAKCTLISAAWKGHVQRKMYAATLGKVRTVQRLGRAFKERLRCQRTRLTIKHVVAPLIQRVGRAFARRKIFVLRYNVKFQKAIRLFQRCGRALRVRKSIGDYRVRANKAVTRLSAWWKGVFLRFTEKRRKQRQRILGLQGLTHKTIHGVPMPSIDFFIHVIKDTNALKIQTWYRMHLAQKVLARLKRKAFLRRMQGLSLPNAVLATKPLWIPSKEARTHAIEHGGWHDDFNYYEMKKDCFKLLGLPEHLAHTDDDRDPVDNLNALVLVPEKQLQVVEKPPRPPPNPNVYAQSIKRIHNRHKPPKPHQPKPPPSAPSTIRQPTTQSSLFITRTEDFNQTSTSPVTTVPENLLTPRQGEGGGGGGLLPLIPLAPRAPAQVSARLYSRPTTDPKSQLEMWQAKLKEVMKSCGQQEGRKLNAQQQEKLVERMYTDARQHERETTAMLSKRYMKHQSGMVQTKSHESNKSSTIVVSKRQEVLLTMGKDSRVTTPEDGLNVVKRKSSSEVTKLPLV